MLRMQEHLFHHCCLWRDRQKALWKVVGKATGWKVGVYQHEQISELYSKEKCDQEATDLLAATDIGRFPQQLAEEPGHEEPGEEEHR